MKHNHPDRKRENEHWQAQFARIVIILLLAAIYVTLLTSCDQITEPTYHIEQSITQHNDSIFAVQTAVLNVKYYDMGVAMYDTLYQTRIGSYESFLGQVLVNEYQKAESILNYFRDKQLVQTYEKEGKIVIDTIRFKHLK